MAAASMRWLVLRVLATSLSMRCSVAAIAHPTSASSISLFLACSLFPLMLRSPPHTAKVDGKSIKSQIAVLAILEYEANVYQTGKVFFLWHPPQLNRFLGFQVPLELKPGPSLAHP